MQKLNIFLIGLFLCSLAFGSEVKLTKVQEDKFQELLEQDTSGDLSKYGFSKEENVEMLRLEALIDSSIITKDEAQVTKEDELLLDRHDALYNKREEAQERWIKEGPVTRLLARYASKPDKIDFFKKLLKKGADVNRKDEDGNYPIYNAMQVDNSEAVRLLLEYGANIDFVNKNGQPFVVVTGYYDSPNVMKLLLINGTNINATSKDGTTALMAASKKGNIEVVKLLIDKGASHNHKMFFKSLINSVLQNDNNPKTVQKLINDFKLDVRHLDEGKEIPFLYFAMMDKTYAEWSDKLHKSADALVSMLKRLKNKQKPIISDDNKSSSTLTNSRYPSLETVKVLINNGAKFNTYDILKYSLRHSHTKDLSIFKYLIKSGANIEIRNGTESYECKTLLIDMAEGQIRASGEHSERVKLLLEYGADINVQDCEGNTALHKAIYVPESFNILLKYNPNIHLKDIKGKSIVDLCKGPLKGMFASNKNKSCKILKNYMDKAPNR